MSAFVTEGAVITCPMGAAPANLKVTSQSKVLYDGKPVATIQDASAANVGSFGMCSSLANPQVASATAAALGVLTPQSCTFSSAGSWIPEQTKVCADGKPCLTTGAQVFCTTGMQMCTIAGPSQTKVIS